MPVRFKSRPRSRSNTRSPRENRRSHDRCSSPLNDVILTIPAETAKELQQRATRSHGAQQHLVARRIKELKKALGSDGKTKTRATEHITERIQQDQKKEQKAERDKRQLLWWRAARNELDELDPSQNVCDALQALNIGPLINAIQYLDGVDETQTHLADLRAKCENRRRELRRVESEISQIEKELEEQDDQVRRRVWRRFKSNREYLKELNEEQD